MTMDKMNLLNAVARLEHDAMMLHDGVLVKNCSRRRYLLSAIDDRLTIEDAINQAVYEECRCHPDLTRDQLLDYLRDPSYRLHREHPPVKNNLEPQLIYIIDPQGEVKGIYHPTRRGRELAERHLKVYQGTAYAYFIQYEGERGEIIPWVTGRLGDYFIDSSALAEAARIPEGYR